MIDVKEGSKYSEKFKELSNEWKHVEHTDEELKQIAMDLYHNKIFSNFHIPQHSKYLITSVFMPIIFMNHINWDTENTRENKIIRVMLEDLEKGFHERYQKYIDNVGMIYEEYSKASPQAINGLPTFFSMKILSKNDTDKMWIFHDKYKELQDKAKEDMKNF